MDTFDCIATKLDVRSYVTSRRVPPDLKLKILEAGRLTASGVNKQHWRFLVIQEREGIQQLAKDSSTGKWVAGADFAIVILTDITLPFRGIDAGRAVQDMQLAAWNYGVVSGVFTGADLDALRRDFNIPPNMEPTITVGFGYPATKITGKKKNRKPLEELVFLERFGNKFNRNAV